MSAPYLNAAHQLNARLRAMLDAWDKLPEHERQLVRKEFKATIEAVREARRLHEIETGELVAVEPPFEG